MLESPFIVYMLLLDKKHLLLLELQNIRRQRSYGLYTIVAANASDPAANAGLCTLCWSMQLENTLEIQVDQP